MTKVTLNLPKGEIIRILSQLSVEEREEIMEEVMNERRVLKPRLIPIEEVMNLNGVISLGGDASIDTERTYDE